MDNQGLEQKYRYSFKLDPPKPVKQESEPEKKELQAYVNKLLSLPKEYSNGDMTDQR
jgi:hypothetical protein